MPQFYRQDMDELPDLDKLGVAEKDRLIRKLVVDGAHAVGASSDLADKSAGVGSTAGAKQPQSQFEQAAG